MGKKVYKVLMLDSGGMHGVISARVIKDIEERTGKPIAECFDLVCGSSTGAILACGLTTPDPENPSKPKYKAADLLQMYKDLGRRIFYKSTMRHFRKASMLFGGTAYNPGPLEEIMKEQFGDSRIKDSLTSLIIPTADIERHKSLWIRHFKDYPGASDTENLKMADVVRAATSAPMFFPARHIEAKAANENGDDEDRTVRYAPIDGGVLGGAIPRVVLTKAKELAPEDAEIVFVFAGNGRPTKYMTPDEYNRQGLVGGVKNVMSMSLDLTMDAILRDIGKELGDNFYYLQAPLVRENTDDPVPSDSIDDASEENLHALELVGEHIIKTNDKALDRLAEILKTKELPAPEDQVEEWSLKSVFRGVSKRVNKALNRLDPASEKTAANENAKSDRHDCPKCEEVKRRRDSHDKRHRQRLRDRLLSPGK